MTELGLRPYTAGDNPHARSVPVSVVILTLNEELNIRRCLDSVAWAGQVIVVDSGSTDQTIAVARSLGAEVVEQPWLGFSAQREFALRLPQISHNWVYFVDADQWISPQLAAEAADKLRAPDCAAFAHRLRLVFLDRWIRHCGWYSGSWNVQLMDRRHSAYDGNIIGERVSVSGAVRRLSNDIVDQDSKGLASWLHKHVRYAQLEARRRGKRPGLGKRIRSLPARGGSRTLSRALLKDIIFPYVPAKPVVLFIYMYVARFGVLDGAAGLRFCFYHAWYEASVAALQYDPSAVC